MVNYMYSKKWNILHNIVELFKHTINYTYGMKLLWHMNKIMNSWFTNFLKKCNMRYTIRRISRYAWKMVNFRFVFCFLSYLSTYSTQFLFVREIPTFNLSNKCCLYASDRWCQKFNGAPIALARCNSIQ